MSEAQNGSHTETNGPTNGAVDDVTVRCLITSKDAGLIIGKGGKNVADLREATSVKAGVTKVVPDVNERVLTISGSLEGVAKAYSLVVQQLLDPDARSQQADSDFVPPSHCSLQILVSHNVMGSIIGRSGARIKAIQSSSGTRIVAHKDMLPQSTERVVEVQGNAQGIGRAVEEIGRCFIDDTDKSTGTVLYNPGSSESQPGRRSNNPRVGSQPRRNGGLVRAAPEGDMPSLADLSLQSQSTASKTPASLIDPPAAVGADQSKSSTAGLTTQEISIPSDMVGCIIGRSGSKITEIRRLSGSKISIAKVPHDETGERMFTITGTAESNEKALYLLYNQLETEKERRVGKEAADLAVGGAPLAA